MKNLKNLFVSSDWFFCFLLCSIIVTFRDHDFFWLIASLSFILILLKKTSLTLVLVFILFIIRLIYPFSLPEFQRVQIVKISDSQTIFKDGMFYASSFGTQFGQVGDKLILNATFEVHEPSIYQQGLFLKNNLGNLKIESTRFIENKHSLQSKLFQIVQDKQDETLSLYLFNEGSDFVGDSSLYLALVSMGIHYSASLSICRSILEKVWTQRVVKVVVLAIIGLLISLFGFSFILLRLLVSNLLPLKGSSKTFAEMCIVLLFYPMALSAPIFILTYGIKLARFIHQSIGESIFIKTSYLALLQLDLFYRFNILESLLFQVFRKLSGAMFLLCLVSVGLPTTSLLTDPHQLFIHILSFINLEFLTIVGQPNLFINLVWLGILVLLPASMKKKLLSQFMIYAQVLFFLVDASVRVVYIDVGQGDATLIKYPHHQGAALIDTGKSNQYSKLKAQLYKSGLKEIDTLIITHPDEDHNGSQAEIMKQFKVKQLVTESPVEIESPINFYFLLENRSASDSNDASLIITFKVMDCQFLFTGDVSRAIEKALLKEYPLLKADILKLGHHGSRTSSDERFLHQMNPKLAIISSDPNSYSHPHPEVMRSLVDLKINSLQTSEVSSIEIIITKYVSFVRTRKHFYFLN